MAVLLLALPACGRSPSMSPPPSPSPSPSGPVAVGTHTGPTAITLLEAVPAPGSVVTCGPEMADCQGRLRIRLLLAPTQTGTSLWTAVTLHATNHVACLRGQIPGASLEAGRSQEVEVVLDQSDAFCRTPLTITNMAAVVEGTIEVASRQEWSIAYEIKP
jgi:hypothetical protein